MQTIKRKIMITVKQLRDFLGDFNQNSEVRWVDGSQITHINSVDDIVVISDEKYIGYCKKCGNEAYTEKENRNGYKAYCIICDENLYSCEVSTLKAHNRLYTGLLSKEFSKLIRESFDDSQLVAINALNRTPEYSDCCATHDYMDANEVMAEAFINTMGFECDVQNEADKALWSAAWNYSKQMNFAN